MKFKRHLRRELTGCWRTMKSALRTSNPAWIVRFWSIILKIIVFNRILTCNQTWFVKLMPLWSFYVELGGHMLESMNKIHRIFLKTESDAIYLCPWRDFFWGYPVIGFLLRSLNSRRWVLNSLSGWFSAKFMFGNRNEIQVFEASSQKEPFRNHSKKCKKSNSRTERSRLP